MKYQRTQIYLDPKEHRRLIKEAAARGVSLAEYLRQVIGAREAAEPSPSYAERSFEGIFDLIPSEVPTQDTVEDMDEEVGAAFEEAYQRSLSRPTSSKNPRKRRKR